MFLKPVDEQEVFIIIHECKSKTLEDCDHLIMNLFKQIITAVILQFTHICNLSF